MGVVESNTLYKRIRFQFPLLGSGDTDWNCWANWEMLSIPFVGFMFLMPILGVVDSDFQFPLLGSRRKNKSITQNQKTFNSLCWVQLLGLNWEMCIMLIPFNSLCWVRGPETWSTLRWTMTFNSLCWVPFDVGIRYLQVSIFLSIPFVGFDCAEYWHHSLHNLSFNSLCWVLPEHALILIAPMTSFNSLCWVLPIYASIHPSHVG